jgi:hypothetical protein
LRREVHSATLPGARRAVAAKGRPGTVTGLGIGARSRAVPAAFWRGSLERRHCPGRAKAPPPSARAQRPRPAPAPQRPPRAAAPQDPKLIRRCKRHVFELFEAGELRAWVDLSHGFRGVQGIPAAVDYMLAGGHVGKVVVPL